MMAVVSFGHAVCLFGFFFQLAQSKAGVDLSVATTEADWTCLVKDHDVKYAIVRTYRNLGAVDENSAPSLKLAAKAGVADLGAYIFPCITTSPYSISKNITCDSADDQVLKTVNYLKDNGVFIGDKSFVTFGKDNVLLNRMWIDVEDEAPSKYYDPNTTVNQEFLAAMVSALNTLKIPVGIYTTKTYWTNIVNNVEGYGGYPLWYPRYDDVDSMDFFAPFGGWTSCYIKQTGGDFGYCGISQVDPDYMQ